MMGGWIFCWIFRFGYNIVKCVKKSTAFYTYVWNRIGFRGRCFKIWDIIRSTSLNVTFFGSHIVKYQKLK